MYLEFEKKGLLKKEDYTKVLANNTINRVIIQTNYYFETKDEYFKNNNSALRVRLTDDTCELTLKVRKELSNIEYNHFIDDVTFFDMVHNFKIPQIIYNYIDERVKINSVIHFETKRSVILFDGHDIEIDETDFGDNIDYEIEVEGENMKIASEIFHGFINANNVEVEKSAPKIARFFKYNK